MSGAGMSFKRSRIFAFRFGIVILKPLRFFPLYFFALSVALNGSCTFAADSLVERVKAYDVERARVVGMSDGAEARELIERYQFQRREVIESVGVEVLVGSIYGNSSVSALQWFWLNHFSVYWNKSDIALLLDDYSIQVKFGSFLRFSDLLRVVIRHPAMVSYLDNGLNKRGGLNENFARELLELHTVGLESFAQSDVFDLARVLSGVGRTPVSQLDHASPAVKGFIRDGLFQFDPRRHDNGTKLVLGHVIQPGGWNEIEQVIDLLSKHPSTAQHISRKLVTYMVADEPPPHLVASTAAVFRNTDGDLRAVVDHVLASPECMSQPMTKLKSSWEYVVSVLQTTYPDAPPADPKPVLNGLNRLGQPLFGRSTPDGYSLKGADWLTPALLLTRIEFARQMVGLAKRDGQLPKALPDYWMKRVGVDTRRQIALANGNVEKFVLLLSSPEFMLRESCLPGVTVH